MKFDSSVIRFGVGDGNGKAVHVLKTCWAANASGSNPNYSALWYTDDMKLIPFALLLVACATVPTKKPLPSSMVKVTWIDGSATTAKTWVCDFDDKEPNHMHCIDSTPVFNYICPFYKK